MKPETDYEKIIEDVNDYLQELKDNGFISNTQLWRNGYEIAYVEFKLSTPSKVVNNINGYREIRDMLEEAFDRIQEFYEIDGISMQLETNTHTGRRYFKKLPETLSGFIKCIFLDVSPKKEKSNLIKRFFNF